MLNKFISFLNADFKKQIPHGYQIKNISALELDKSLYIYLVLMVVFLLLFCFSDSRILLLLYLLSLNTFILLMSQLREEKKINGLIYVFLADFVSYLNFYHRHHIQTQIPLNEFAIIAVIALTVALFAQKVVLKKDIELKIHKSKIITNNEIQARKEKYAHYLGQTATCIGIDTNIPSRITIDYRGNHIPAYSTEHSINCNDIVEIINIEHVIEKTRYSTVLVTKFYVKKV